MNWIIQKFPSDFLQIKTCAETNFDVASFPAGIYLLVQSQQRKQQNDVLNLFIYLKLTTKTADGRPITPKIIRKPKVIP